jgi:general L-amino acid transport system permease protein
MPAISAICVVFIEFIRGVPLITLLFFGSMMLPLFLPEGLDIDTVLRALVAVIIFQAAYGAEVVRGGLQAMPKGQYEAAQALGLSYWQMNIQIILPQALKITIPALVNTAIGLFQRYFISDSDWFARSVRYR